MNGASDERRVRTSYDKTESPDQRWPACCIRAARSSQRIEERDLPAVAGGGGYRWGGASGRAGGVTGTCLRMPLPALASILWKGAHMAPGTTIRETEASEPKPQCLRH